ncbi:hypothetical protein pEaSNUABM10_00082 [Erwinia phage pEa_SNUABM_10]|nr:hypothetical protein pEaSNUABM10_00082 [Erwinia phage pEa_SNUABM_10]
MAYGRFQQIVNYHIAQAAGLPPVEYNAVVTVKGIPLTVIRVHSLIHSGNFFEDITTLTHLTLVVPFSQMRIATANADGDLKVQITLRSANRLLGTYAYRGIVVSNRDPDMESQTMFSGQSDEKSIAFVTFELMDESIWFLRLRNVKVRHQETDALTVARAILADTLPASSNEGEVLSLSYEKEDQQLYRNIILPDSTTFLEVFDKLQERYGIYSKGLGVYQHLRRWYLYQLWDEEKFNTATEKVVIYNLPREKAAQIDKTIHITPGVLYLITGGDTTTVVKTDENALNHGTGYRVGSIRALDNRASSFTPGGVSMTTPDKFVSQANPVDYAGKVTNAPVAKQGFTDNDKPLRAKLARSTGTFVKVTWNRAAHGLIKPGMAVKYVYANEYGIYSRYGTVVGEVFQAGLDGGSIATANHNTQSELTLWLGKQKNTA